MECRDARCYQTAEDSQVTVVIYMIYDYWEEGYFVYHSHGLSNMYYVSNAEMCMFSAVLLNVGRK